jgi:hypothetical protein
MTDKPQTQKDMLVTLLDKVLVLTEKVVETQSQVVEINHTIHNGMSKAIQDTARQVTTIEGDLSDVKRGLERIGTEGHPQSCPFLADQKQRKMRFWGRLTKFQKALVWLISLGGTLFAWAQLVMYLKGI